MLPLCRSSRRIRWYPNSDFTGSGASSPTCSAKLASSKAGSIIPLLTHPRSPPLSALPGSSGMFLRQFREVRSVPQLSQDLLRLATRALGFLLRLVDCHEQDVAHLDTLGLFESVLVLGIVEFDLGVADLVLRRRSCRVDRNQLERSTFRVAIAQAIRIEVRLATALRSGTRGPRGRPRPPLPIRSGPRRSARGSVRRPPCR